MSAIPTIFIVVTLSFFLMRVAPGGPFNLERPLEPQTLENLKRAFLLDRPLVVQYGHYLWNLLHGDLGPSFIYRDFTVAVIANSLPYSMTLGAWALLLAVAGGIAIGSYAALRRNSFVDYAVMTVASFGITVPNFVLAPILSFVFAVVLRWLPAGGWGDGGVANLLLPVISLALPQLAVFARITRGSMIETLRADHIRTARAYGLQNSRGGDRPCHARGPRSGVSYLGPVAAVLTGSVVVETVFGLPGVGRYFVLGALNRDYTLVMGTVVLISVFIVVFNLLVDILYAVLDPRVRYE